MGGTEHEGAEGDHDHARDEADLAAFGYRQELKRALGLFSSFAVAFSYIAPSTGGGAMLVNFAWPRAVSNPTPDQTGGLLDLHWAWLNSQPVLWTVFVVTAGVGAIYFALVQRRKPAYLQTPSGAFAPETPVAGDAVST